MTKSLFRYALNSIVALILCVALIALPLATMAGAASPEIANGGFENGDLSGWTVGSTNGTVEVLQAGNFDPVISPTEGSYFALLSTNGGNETKMAGPSSSLRTNTGTAVFGNGIDLDGNGFPDNDIASLTQTFELSAGELPATLSFDWSFLTDEGDEYDDFFMVTLNGIDILHGSVPDAMEYISPFENVPPLDGQEYDVYSSGPTDSSYFEYGRTSFQHFSYAISSAGTYTLEFLIADQEDADVDSGLLIDDIRLTASESCLQFSATPTTGATPLEVQFINETTCDCSSWSWDFGDGSSSSENNPSHTYARPGPYTVTLTCISPGSKIVRTKVDYIHPYTVGVGAEAYPVNPLSRIVPLFAIGAFITAGIIMLWRKRVKIDC